MFLQIKDIKHIERDFVLMPGVTWECPGGQKIEYGHVAYQIAKDDEKNRIQVNFSPFGLTGGLG